MKKEELKAKLEEAGDAVITYRSQNSRKLKYNVCTADFSTEYIRQKRNRAKEGQHTVLLFCWDTDWFKAMREYHPTKFVNIRLKCQTILQHLQTEF